MEIVPAVWLLVALLAALARGSPTDFFSRPLGEEVLEHQPLQEEARKIDGGSSKLPIKILSKEAFSKYSIVLPTKKGNEGESKPPRVVVLQNGDPTERVNRIGGQETVYINNKAVNVEYVNKNTLPQDHPLRRVADKKKKDDNDNFNAIFQSLFEIIQDILTIMIQPDTQDAAEKSENGDVTAVGGLDKWSMTRKVFLKYLRLLKTSDVLAEFREVIPVTELESAFEKGDQVSLARIFIKSITPGFCSYILGLLKDIAAPLLHLSNNLGTAELREYIPGEIDLLWPVRFFARRTLGWIGNYFSRRELVNYWEQFRSLSPFAARSQEFIFPGEEDEETSMNSLMTNEISEQDGKSLFESALDHPYLLLAGVGSTVMVSVFAYKATSSDFTEGNRIKRNAMEETQSYPWDNMSFSDLVKIISAVESNAYVDNFDDSDESSAVKPMKTSNKKYSSSQGRKKKESKSVAKAMPTVAELQPR